jgi:hypothetical protein
VLGSAGPCDGDPGRRRVAPRGWEGNRSDLAGIRDAAELTKLPETEQVAFRSLWADVEALRKKAEDKAKAAGSK